MPNKFEQPLIPSPEEESGEKDIEQEEIEKSAKENEDLEKIGKIDTGIEKEEALSEKVDSALRKQEKVADIEEQISMSNLPEQEASLFGRAKEKLKANLRNAVLFGVMATSLLGAGCKEKSPEKSMPNKPAAVRVEKEEKKIIIERNGRKIVTTERAQRMLAEGRRQAQRIMEQQREVVNREIEIMDKMSGEDYVRYKIAVIDRHIETMEEGNENGAWDKEIDESKKEKAELERILKTGKSEDYAKSQRQGFEEFSKTAENRQPRKERKETKGAEKGYDDEVVEAPDFTDLDPTLRKK